MRTSAILLAALVMALGPPAVLAASDKAPPGRAVTPAEPPGQVEKADKPEPPGQVKKDVDTPGGGSNGQSGANDQNEAQRAVEASEALPLRRILSIVRSRTSGHVINARLLRVDGALLYQLTLLDEAGRSWREYYDARTGDPVSRP